MSELNKLKKENERLKKQAVYDAEVKRLKSENRSLKLEKNKGVKFVRAVGSGLGFVGAGLFKEVQGLQKARESHNFKERPKKVKRVKKVKRGAQIGLNNAFFN